MPDYPKSIAPVDRAKELTELFAHLMANVFTNYFKHYVGTELDLPAAPPAS